MRIIELRASNVKALKAVTIRPNGDVVTIAGKNGAGKSSVLDSIWYALGGKNAIPGEPIRRGEKSAEVMLDLGDLRVRRRITEKGTTLDVTSKDGAKYPSPQAMLDSLLSTLAFDPWAFARMSGKEQRAALLDLLGIDTGDIDREFAAAYEKRRDLNRDLKVADQRAEDATARAPESDPGPVRSQGEIASQITAAREAQRACDSADAEVFHYQREAEEAASDIKRLQAQLAEAKNAFNVAIKRQVEAQAARDSLPAPSDIDALMAEMNSLSKHNDSAEAYQRARQAREHASALLQQVSDVEDRMRTLVSDKAKRLASADMPLPDLSIDDEGLRYRGTPYDQCSSAERLRVAIAICMANNPKLRVARIEDGSLLDEDSLAMLEEMAHANDFQVWIERVDTSGQVGIVIEDGAVRETTAAA